MISSETIIRMLTNLWGLVKSHPLYVGFWIVKNVLVVGGAALAIGYTAFSQSEVSSKELSSDFGKIAATQDTLMNDALRLQTALLKSDREVELLQELQELRTNAEASLISLALLRAPTSSIERARYEYKSSLEQLIGVVNYLLREGSTGQAARLYDALQHASNTAGNLRGSIERFQGGAIPQVLGGIF